MSSYYYLVSQLPNISGLGEKSALPITPDEFKSLCSRFLDGNSRNVVMGLSLVPPEQQTRTGSPFLDAWYGHERNLRLALAQIRAQKMRKDFYQLPGSCTADILQCARTAVGMSSPLAAEQFLFDYRMKVLDDLRPLDGFSIDAVYEYGVRLLLVSRMKKFDTENGRNSYHRIYDTILGESL